HLVPFLALGVILFLGRFEQHGQAGEARVREDVREAGVADLAEADVGVAVDARIERGFAVVEVPGADFFHADVFAGQGDHALVAGARANVVTGGEDVARVDADADALRLLHRGDDLAELFKRAAETGALTGG